MSLSKTDIINKSLTLVGAAPIINIDDDTNNARIINRVYESALRSILSECKWNFATKRILLTVSADVLNWYDTGENVIYIRPTDVIKIFGVNSPTARWREEGDYIISDTSGLGIRYVYFLETTSKYTSEFTNAFIDRLASDVSYAIVNSSTLGEKYKSLYESVSLPKAMSSNSQSGYQQTLKDDSWELAKFTNISPDA